MSRISGGGRPPGTETDPLRPGGDEAKTQDSKGTVAQGQSKSVDSFERKIEKQLQNLSGTALAGKLQFSSAELAQIAAAFAFALRQNSRADRKERARMFARELLKKKKLGKLLEQEDHEVVEELFESIAEQIDGSPVFAQLMDDVTESARKINLG